MHPVPCSSNGDADHPNKGDWFDRVQKLDGNRQETNESASNGNFVDLEGRKAAKEAIGWPQALVV